MLVNTNSNDASGNFYARFCRESDLSTDILDVGCVGTGVALGGVVFDDLSDVSLQYGQITIDTTPEQGDQDHARFKMTGLTGLGEAVLPNNPVDLVFTIKNDLGGIAYTFSGEGIVEGNRLSLHKVVGDGEEKITCRLSTELCSIFIERDVDINEDALDDNPLTISLEVNDTEYSDTGDWAGAVFPERTLYIPAPSDE
ncbi:MAG: hypothetical protein D3903_12155 [Candidatus Electrothrix sp. GM3_4]|nr:hypothetical protein [Candidatus Electrothrix sp. GM3_4]